MDSITKKLDFIIEELENISENIQVLSKKIADLDTNIDIMDEKIANIEEKMIICIRPSPPKREPFRITKIKHDYDDGLKFIKEHNIECDVELIKKIYVTNVHEPSIRYVNRNVYQYWIDGMWKDDLGGKYIAKTIARCLASYYKTVIGSLLKQNEVYLEHMTYIGKMETEKYQKDLANELKRIIAVE